VEVDDSGAGYAELQTLVGAGIQLEHVDLDVHETRAVLKEAKLYERCLLSSFASLPQDIQELPDPYGRHIVNNGRLVVHVGKIHQIQQYPTKVHAGEKILDAPDVLVLPNMAAARLVARRSSYPYCHFSGSCHRHGSVLLQTTGFEILEEGDCLHGDAEEVDDETAEYYHAQEGGPEGCHCCLHRQRCMPQDCFRCLAAWGSLES
jgi:hypothetical protein